MNSEVKQSLRKIAFHTLGIIPIESEDTSVRKHLESLPPEEARRAKRKFRKLWKKLVKQYKYTIHEDRLGNGEPKPDAMHVLYRKRMVLANIDRWINRTLKNLSRDTQKLEGKEDQ